MRVPEIRRHIIVKAPPERAFDAWTEPEHLSRWFCDKVVGWPGYGGTLTMTWEKFGFTMDYNLRTIVPPKRIVMKSLIPGMGMQTLNISIRPYGSGCRIEIVETGPGAEGQEGAGDAKSGWEMSLALLKIYLENFWAKDRRMIFAIITAPYEEDRLMYYYRSAEGLANWLTEYGSIGEAGSEVKLKLKNKLTLTGRVMAVTDHELVVTWKEINGFLELKSFIGSSDRKAILVRGSTYGTRLTDEKLRKLNKFIERSIGNLHLILRKEEEARLEAARNAPSEEEEDLDWTDDEDAVFDDEDIDFDDEISDEELEEEERQRLAAEDEDHGREAVKKTQAGDGPSLSALRARRRMGVHLEDEDNNEEEEE